MCRCSRNGRFADGKRRMSVRGSEMIIGKYDD